MSHAHEVRTPLTLLSLNKERASSFYVGETHAQGNDYSPDLPILYKERAYSFYAL